MTLYRQLSLLLTTVVFVLAQLFVPAGVAIAQSLDYRDSSTGVSINLETGEVTAEKAQDISEETVKEISGSRFDDVLIGNRLDNTLRGLDGDDEIYGKAGNDFLFGEVGADLLDGGEGADLIGYVRSRAGVTINLETNIASGGDAEGDTIRSIEKVDGSRFDDTLIGNESANTLRGFDGDDEIYGKAGNDFLFGEIGADLLDGGEGADLVGYIRSPEGVTINLETNTALGGDAEGDTIRSIESVDGSRLSDVLIGNEGVNSLRGFDGDDEIYGKAGNDFLFGERGGDLLDGGEGTDFIDYIRSREGVTINLETNTASGGDAEGDTIRSIENVTGSRLDDVLIGNEGANTLRGFDGNDELFGKEGDDSLIGDAGADILDGGDGNDRLTGGQDSDVFIIGRGQGSDEILDFEIDVDIIEIAAPLGLRDIEILVVGDDTQIFSVASSELLATVRKVNGRIDVKRANIDTPEQDLAGESFEEARHIRLATDGVEYAAWVGQIDTQDYYSFSLGAPNRMSFNFSSDEEELLFQVFDNRENLVASNNIDKSFTLIRSLEPGPYRIRVASADGKDSFYKIKLASKPQIPGFPNITTTKSDADIKTSLAESIPLIRVNNFRSGDVALGSRLEYSNIDGRGFSVVVIDTGIELDHPFFGGDGEGNVSSRIVYQEDFADDDMDASDIPNNGHGSLVASIAVSEDDIFTGVAPRANIIPLKVFRTNPLPFQSPGTFDEVQSALQWVLVNTEKYNIASVNLSSGEPVPCDINGDGVITNIDDVNGDGILNDICDSNYNTNTTQRLLGIDDEIEALGQKGVVVIAASGNDFDTYNQAQGIAYPAADPNTIAVGAVEDGGNLWLDGGTPNNIADDTLQPTIADRIAFFSQRHPNLTTIFAPGHAIAGAGPDNHPRLRMNNENTPLTTQNGTIEFSGTSFAAPHIAGMAALAQQLAQQELNRQLSPIDPNDPTSFSELLQETGDPINDDVTNVGTFRRANMLNLANAIMELRSPESLNIDLKSRRFDIAQTVLSKGARATVNFEIQNSGLDAAGSFDVKFYLSENTSITERDYLLDSHTVNRLRANSSTNNISRTFTLPALDSSVWGEKIGNSKIYIGMIVDVDNEVVETNENNNRNQGILIDYDEIEVNSGVDLAADRFSILQPSANTGESLTINYRVKNEGSNDSESFIIDFYLSPNETISENDYRLGSSQINSVLADSDSGNRTITLNLPNLIAPIWRSYASKEGFIGMIIDADTEVDETDERNNKNTDLGKDYADIRIQPKGSVSVTLRKFEGDFDGLPFDHSEFYGGVRIANSSYRTRKFEGNKHKPNIRYIKNIDKSDVPIKIVLTEDDGGTIFNCDERVEDLELSLNVFTGELSGDLTRNLRNSGGRSEVDIDRKHLGFSIQLDSFSRNESQSVGPILTGGGGC